MGKRLGGLKARKGEHGGRWALSPSLSLSIYIYIYMCISLSLYIYIYLCICMCVCVCVCPAPPLIHMVGDLTPHIGEAQWHGSIKGERIEFHTPRIGRAQLIALDVYLVTL